MTLINIVTALILISSIVFGMMEGIKSKSTTMTIACSVLTAVTLLIAYLLIPSAPPPPVKKGRTLRYSDVLEKV